MARKRSKPAVPAEMMLKLAAVLGVLWVVSTLLAKNPQVVTLLILVGVVAGGAFVARRYLPAYRRLQRRRLLGMAELQQMDSMSGYDFEIAISEVFRRLGYAAEVTSTTRDQGADVILSRDGRRIAVQTKRQSSNVGNEAVQQVVSAKAIYGATEAMVVTTSDFTPSARQAATANGVELVGRAELAALMAEAKAQKSMT